MVENRENPYKRMTIKGTKHTLVQFCGYSAVASPTSFGTVNYAPEIPSTSRQLFHFDEQPPMEPFYVYEMDILPREDDVPYDAHVFCALDCEMVRSGERSVLARVSIVDFNGIQMLDTPVKPEAPVTDYVSHITALCEGDLDDAPSFEAVRLEVAAIINNRILVGHALENDLKILELYHPPHMIRDTAHVKSLRLTTQNSFQMPSLVKLMSQCLPDVPFRLGFHDSKEDAFAPMLIYKRYWRGFEQSIDKGTLTCHPDLQFY